MRASSDSVYVFSESSTSASLLPQAAREVPAAASITDDRSSARIFLFLRFV